MAAQSPSPSPSTGAEIAQPANVDQHDTRKELVKQGSMTSVFVNTEPMREEQVQNAVKFLSHPKVRGSPVIQRRSFLERKGLTKEEIDEAFRRVPDSPSSEQTAVVNQDGQLKPSSQQQGQSQALLPVTSASTGIIASLGTLSRRTFCWSHALIAIGVLAASGAGTAWLIKNSVLPWLKYWIRNVVIEEEYYQRKRTESKPTLAEEAAYAAKAAAAAAADLAKASQEMLTSKSEEKRYFAEVVKQLDEQVQEMKLFLTFAIRRFEASSGLSVSQQEQWQDSRKSSKVQQLIGNAKADYELRSVRSPSPTASIEPSSAPHPKSYMEIMAMIQRGEKPSNIRDIDDAPPNPYQQPSIPRLAPRSKPWEGSQVQSTSNQVFRPQVSSKDLNFKVQDNDHHPVPWWQMKNGRIKEIDDGIEYNQASTQYDRQPAQRAWVPPQSPPVAMPEAAEAIRHPKPMVQKEKIPDDQSVAHSSDISNGTERISKRSKSEGAIESGSVNTFLSSGEIEDHETNYEEK